MLLQLDKIKLMGFDMDGVMTDATIQFVEGTGWSRRFNIRDGQGLRYLQDAGVKIAVISAGAEEKFLRARFTFLKFDHIIFGSKDKLADMDGIREQEGFEWSEVGFMGDDGPDIPLLKKVGFAVTVPDCVPQVKKNIHYVTKQHGGLGAVREICDHILYARGKHPLGLP